MCSIKAWRLHWVNHSMVNHQNPQAYIEFDPTKGNSHFRNYVTDKNLKKQQHN
jgi:hypothetical protein